MHLVEQLQALHFDLSIATDTVTQKYLFLYTHFFFNYWMYTNVYLCGKDRYVWYLFIVFSAYLIVLPCFLTKFWQATLQCTCVMYA